MALPSSFFSTPGMRAFGDGGLLVEAEFTGLQIALYARNDFAAKVRAPCFCFQTVRNQGKKGRGTRLGDALGGCAGRLRSFPNPSFQAQELLHVVRLTLSHGPHRSLRDEATASRHVCFATAAVPSVGAPLLRPRRRHALNRFAEKSCRSAP